MAQRGGDARLGFTLIEILVVITVIGLLAALVGPRILGRVAEAKSATAKAQVELLSVALDNYRLDNGSYPTTEQGLDALQEKPTREPIPLNWRGPYLKRAIPTDPWGRPYVYRSPGEHDPGGNDLSSLGKDGQPGGDGEDADITNWK
jgi:general secretion pathway protein G